MGDMMEKLTGIWLDKKSAHIVVLEGKEERSIIIQSDMEDTHPKGGSGSSTPWSPKEVVSESKVMERKKHQSKKYYATIIAQVEDSEKLFIMGPGQARLAFNKEMQRHARLGSKVVEVRPADSMTENQIRASVRNFFRENSKTR